MGITEAPILDSLDRYFNFDATLEDAIAELRSANASASLICGLCRVKRMPKARSFFRPLGNGDRCAACGCNSCEHVDAVCPEVKR